jgi:hypothetical protein
LIVFCPRMSNPWSTSVRDIALAPLYKTLKKYDAEQPDEQQPQLSIQTENLQNNHSIEIQTHPPQQQSAAKNSSKSQFIANLRRADELNRLRREDPYADGIGYENQKVVSFSRRLTKMFIALSKSLEQFQKADVLKTAYLQAYMANQVMWDDISTENKVKLVNAVRSLLKALKVQLNNQISHHTATAPVFKVRLSELEACIERSGIMDETKNPDDFIIEDLYELLAEALGTLEVIRSVFSTENGLIKS